MLKELLVVSAVFAMLGYASLRRRSHETHSEDQANDDAINTRPKHAATTPIGVIALVIMTCVALIAFYQNKSQISSLTSDMTEEKKCVPPSASELLTAYGGAFTFHRTIETSSELAQKLFDRGLLHLYGYNQIEARRNFEAAVAQDPSCAMCYWGIAYSYGPTINSSPAEANYHEGRSAIEKAFQLSSSRLETHLIRAQGARYPDDYESWRDKGYMFYEEKYADAMLRVYEEHSDDDDVASMFAEAVMNTSPWNYYEPHSDTLNAKGSAAYNTLSTIMVRNEWHPLALHLFIHIIESSSNPSRAEAAADRLVQRSVHGFSGHLMHMPAHIYLRVGRYHDCIEASKMSIANDELYISRCMHPYLPGHNRGLLIACANFNGNMKAALQYSMPVRELPSIAAVYISSVFPAPNELIFSRFGQWQAIRNQQREEEKLFANQLQSLPPYFAAIRFYAKALAAIGSGDLVSARKAQHDLAHAADAIPTSNLPATHPFYPHFQEMGAMMNYTVLASLFGASNEWREAVKYLRFAVDMQLKFGYMEPEVFYLPLNQCLGAAMLEFDKQSGGDFASAENIFAEDLKRHPNNGFGVRGMMQALQEKGNYNDRAQWKLLHQKVWIKDTEVQGACCELNLC